MIQDRFVLRTPQSPEDNTVLREQVKTLNQFVLTQQS